MREFFRKWGTPLLLALILGLQVVQVTDSQHLKFVVKQIIEKLDVVTQKSTEYTKDSETHTVTTIRGQSETYGDFLSRHKQEVDDSKAFDC